MYLPFGRGFGAQPVRPGVFHQQGLILRLDGFKFRLGQWPKRGGHVIAGDFVLSGQRPVGDQGLCLGRKVQGRSQIFHSRTQVALAVIDAGCRILPLDDGVCEQGDRIRWAGHRAGIAHAHDIPVLAAKVHLPAGEGLGYLRSPHRLGFHIQGRADGVDFHKLVSIRTVNTLCSSQSVSICHCFPPSINSPTTRIWRRT